MQFKYDHEEETYRNIDFTKENKKRRRKKEVVDKKTQIEARRKYKNPPGITQLKKNDLLTLCRKNLISQQYHSFYENLIVNKSMKDNEQVVTEQ